VRHLLLLLALFAPSARAQDALQLTDDRGMLVDVTWGDDGELLLSVEARDVSAEALVGLVASRLRIGHVEGFEEVDGHPRVSAHLVERPAHQALRWILGSVGLVAVVGEDTITVSLDVGPSPDGKAMLRKAGTRYFDALRRFPDYPLADRAQMARAKIAEHLGQEQWGAAVLAYDHLIDEYPLSDFVPEAVLRAARLHAQLGNWDQAILRYEKLSKHTDRHPYHAVARAELAEALCRRGEEQTERSLAVAMGEKAVYVLDALDSNYSTQDEVQRYERLLVRARATALAGHSIRALQALDAAARYAPAGEKDPRVLELRARAFARAGEHGAASSAWLAWAEAVGAPAHEDGYQRAARAALESGEEIAVLMICARADELGFGESLAGAEAEARTHLGLPVTGIQGLDAAINLSRGEAHLSERRWDAAREVLRGVYRDRAQLTPDEYVRLAEAYARTLHRLGHEEAAVDVVRVLLRDLAKEGQRRQLYLLAADLYENRQNPRFDLAVEALKGRL
jgi:hypothetical protein